MSIYFMCWPIGSPSPPPKREGGGGVDVYLITNLPPMMLTPLAGLSRRRPVRS